MASVSLLTAQWAQNPQASYMVVGWLWEWAFQAEKLQCCKHFIKPLPVYSLVGSHWPKQVVCGSPGSAWKESKQSKTPGDMAYSGPCLQQLFTITIRMFFPVSFVHPLKCPKGQEREHGASYKVFANSRNDCSFEIQMTMDVFWHGRLVHMTQIPEHLLGPRSWMLALDQPLRAERGKFLRIHRECQLHPHRHSRKARNNSWARMLLLKNNNGSRVLLC